MVVMSPKDGDTFFSGDFPDIRIAGVDDPLNVRMLVNGVEVIAENYYSDASGEVILRNFGEIIQDYFSFPDMVKEKSWMALEALKVNFEFQSPQSIVTKLGLNVYYSRTRVGFGVLTDHYFYSRYKTKYIRENSVDYLTFYVSSNTRVFLDITYVEDGTSKLYSMQQNLYNNADCMFAFRTSLALVSGWANIPAARIISYNFRIKNGSASDIVEFIVDRRQYRDVHQFLYYNIFGFPESVSFTGLTEYNPELEGDIARLSERSLRVSSDVVDVRTINSGYLDSAKYKAAVDMLTSPKIYWYDADHPKEIIITDIDFQHKRFGNEKINVALTFKPALRRDAVFDRISSVYASGIFDYTFDNTFE